MAALECCVHAMAFHDLGQKFRNKHCNVPGLSNTIAIVTGVILKKMARLVGCSKKNTVMFGEIIQLYVFTFTGWGWSELALSFPLISGSFT